MKTLKAVFPDALLVSGATSLAYGAWLAWPPAGFILGGLLAIVAGIKTASTA